MRAGTWNVFVGPCWWAPSPHGSSTPRPHSEQRSHHVACLHAMKCACSNSLPQKKALHGAFFFFFKIFWCGPFLKSLLNLLQYCFCFMFWFFGHKACGILAPRPEIEPTPSAPEGEVLTTGPPGKSLHGVINFNSRWKILSSTNKHWSILKAWLFV